MQYDHLFSAYFHSIQEQPKDSGASHLYMSFETWKNAF